MHHARVWHTRNKESLNKGYSLLLIQVHNNDHFNTGKFKLHVIAEQPAQPTKFCNNCPQKKLYSWVGSERENSKKMNMEINKLPLSTSGENTIQSEHSKLNRDGNGMAGVNFITGL